MNMNITRLPPATPYNPPGAPGGREQPPLRWAIRGPVRLGWTVIALFAAGFGSWAVLAPLASGAVAPGIISPDGNRRVVQHLEGGVIAEIRARDGDHVTKGQAVMLLEQVQAASVRDALLDEYRTGLAARARLTAELFGQSDITFPPELTGDNDPRVRIVMESQRAIFHSRRDLQKAQRQVLLERLAQSDQQIRALQSQVTSTATQIELLADELADKETLLRDALTTKSQVMTLRRQHADLVGQRGDFEAQIAEIGQKRGEIESQLLSLSAESTDYITGELDKTRANLASVTERLNASQDILDRTVVTAPVSGFVVNSRFKSPGGVIVKGEPIMEIVPADEKLLIDARVAVVDIDVVHVGQAATVRLTSLAAYRLPRINGIVRTISADRIVDQNTGQAYYLARVEVPNDEMDKLGHAELVPGMPAEVLIVTGERTMLEYLVEPFEAAFQRSFRET